MDAVLRTESQRLAEDLYRLIQTLDPAKWRADLDEHARELLERVRTRAQALYARLAREPGDGRMAHLRESLRSVADVAEEFSRRMGERRGQRRTSRTREWRDAFKRFQPAYDSLAGRLSRYKVELPRLRPSNYARSLFHVSLGTLCFFLAHYAMTETLAMQIMVSVAGAFWSIEGLRFVFPALNRLLIRWLGSMAHVDEWRKPTSANFFVLAMAIMTSTLPLNATAIGVLALAIGDPAAALVGRKYGRTKLVRARSLEGSSTFFAVTLVVTFAAIMAYEPGATVLAALGVGAIVGFVAALTELVSGRIDDNFTVPLASGIAALLAMSALL